MQTGANQSGDGAIVRRLCSADAQAFRNIRLEGLRDDPTAFGASWDEEAAHPLEWFEDRLTRNLLLGADREGDVVGVAGFYVPSGLKAQHKGVLWGMYVRPQARGLGLGKRLVKGVIEHARECVEELTLGVGLTNQAAMACYKSAGFEVCGLELRALKIGVLYVDELQMSIRFERN